MLGKHENTKAETGIVMQDLSPMMKAKLPES